MNKPFLYVLIATLGLAGCGGGGGGGGGGGSDDSGEFTTISRQDLVGNWIRTETTYDTDAQDERSTWSATSHETVSITLQGNTLNHRDCVTDVNKSATFSNKELSVGTTTFTVVDKNTMTYSTEATEIEYRRMPKSDHASVGKFVVSLPLPPPYPSNVTLPEGEWKEFCASSQQFASGVPVVEFKGIARVTALFQTVDVIMRMKFESYGSSSLFVADTYDYPNWNLVVSGEFSAPEEELGGELYAPTWGTVEVTYEGGRLGFELDRLEMPSEMGDVIMTGPLSLPSAWLEKPEL